jgi:hypothetical protein
LPRGDALKKPVIFKIQIKYVFPRDSTGGHKFPGNLLSQERFARTPEAGYYLDRTGAETLQYPWFQVALYTLARHDPVLPFKNKAPNCFRLHNVLYKGILLPQKYLFKGVNST